MGRFSFSKVSLILKVIKYVNEGVHQCPKILDLMKNTGCAVRTPEEFKETVIRDSTGKQFGGAWPESASITHLALQRLLCCDVTQF